MAEAEAEPLAAGAAMRAAEAAGATGAGAAVEKGAAVERAEAAAPADEAASAPEAGLGGPTLLASGALGSQWRFFSASAASCSAVRWGTLSTKGTGTFVTYRATPRASARPTSSPTTTPNAKPPRWAPRWVLLLVAAMRARSC